jgi:hypothetical protein
MATSPASDRAARQPDLDDAAWNRLPNLAAVDGAAGYLRVKHGHTFRRYEMFVIAVTEGYDLW